MARPYSVELEFNSKDLDDLSRKIRKFPDLVDDAISASVEFNAAYATAWMKANAPWHDNTGAARAGLIAIPHHSGRTHELILAHSVHYGIWLEVAHNRRYAILRPASRQVGPKILSDAKRFLKAMER